MPIGMGDSGKNIQQTVDVVVDRLRRTIESDIQGLVDDIRGSGSASRSQGLDAVRQTDRPVLSRALDAVRQFDQQSTLTVILDTLADVVSAEAPRVAVLVQADGGAVRAWRFTGFQASEGDPRSHTFARETRGMVSRAMVDQQTQLFPAHGDWSSVAHPPAFADLPANGTAVAVPVLVGRGAVAVVYADDGGGADASEPTDWVQVVELLARHAAARLEAVTAAHLSSLANEVLPLELDAPDHGPPRDMAGETSVAAESDPVPVVEKPALAAKPMAVPSSPREKSTVTKPAVPPKPTGVTSSVSSKATVSTSTSVSKWGSRLMLWVLNAALFFVVALYPSYQMSTFAPDRTVHMTFAGAVLVLLVLFGITSKAFFRKT